MVDESFVADDTVSRPPAPAPAPAPVRRRRGVARLRSAAASRRSEGSPTGAVGMRRQLHLQPVAGPSSSRPFVTQASSSNSNSDPFGISIPEDPPLRTPQLDPSSDDDDHDDHDHDDESTNSADQENDSILSPTKHRQTPRKFPGTPRRPQGAPPVPLGELTLEDGSSSEVEAEVEAEAEVQNTSPSSPSLSEEEYPPSPRKLKSPSKSPAKRNFPLPNNSSASSSSGSNSNSNNNPFLQAHQKPQQQQHRSTTATATAALFGPGARNFTPPNGLARPLASDSPYIAYAEAGDDDTTMAEPSPSPRKARGGAGGLFRLPAKRSEVPVAARTLFGSSRPAGGGSGAAGFGFGSINGRGGGTAAAGGGGGSGGGVGKQQQRPLRRRGSNGKSKSQSPPPPPSSAEKRRLRDKRLWELCGGDVRRWNRGEFGTVEEGGLGVKGGRW